MVLPTQFARQKKINEAQDTKDTGIGTTLGVEARTKTIFQQVQEFAQTSTDRFIIQPVVGAAEFLFPFQRPKTVEDFTNFEQAADSRAITVEIKARKDALNEESGVISNVFRIEPRGDLADLISENVLNDYINLQYHIVFSMMPDRELVNLQRQIPQAIDKANTDDVLQLNRRIGAVTLASTGDVFFNDTTIENVNEGREFAEIENAPLANLNSDLTLGAGVERDVSNRHYYNIKSLTLENVFSPSKNNPGLSQMILAKMSLIEPHGFRLVEDLRSIADRIGHKNINLGRIVYRLDIFFSGYNTESGEWIPRISLDPRRSARQDSLSYFVNITTMNAKVEAKGTNYELGLTPAGHPSFLPEEIVLEAQSIATGVKREDGGPQTFGGFIDNLSIALEKSRKTRSNSQIKRTYKFFAPDILRQAKFYAQEFLDEKGLLSKLPDGERVLHIGKDLTLMDILQAALEDMPFVQDSFLADRSNDTFLVPKILWTIRYNTVYENKAPNLNDYENITLEYIIEPYVSYKKATIENKEQAIKVVDPEAQSNRVEAMVRLGMITRIYNYIHTSENTEVKDFDLDFKMLYYTALNTSQDTPTAPELELP